jgi:hypothetical protein
MLPLVILSALCCWTAATAYEHNFAFPNEIETTSYTEPITRMADTPVTLPSGQVLLVEEAKQGGGVICGSHSPYYGISASNPVMLYTDYSSLCSTLNMAMANISYTDLSNINTILSSCADALGGMWLNAVQGYVGSQCLMFTNQYLCYTC